VGLITDAVEAGVRLLVKAWPCVMGALCVLRAWWLVGMVCYIRTTSACTVCRASAC
jgi:hypothetical protein